MATLNTLQERIEERALARFNKDLNNLQKDIDDVVQRSAFTNSIKTSEELKFKTQSHDINASLDSIFFRSIVIETLKNKVLPRYIKEETDKFYSEIEELQKKVGELGKSL